MYKVLCVLLNLEADNKNIHTTSCYWKGNKRKPGANSKWETMQIKCNLALPLQVQPYCDKKKKKTRKFHTERDKHW